MTVLFNAPRNTYGAGATPQSPKTVPIPSTAIALGVTQAVITATRNSWPDIGQDVAVIKMEFSQDGGVTWPMAAEIRTAGGPMTYKGVPSPATVITVPQQLLGDPSNSQRRVRGLLTLFTPLDTAVTVEVF